MPDAMRIPSLRLTELDGSPDIQGVERIYLTSGFLSSLGNGEALLSLSGSAGAGLRVRDVDGTPNVAGVTELWLTNGYLSDMGGGAVLISLSGSASGGAPTTAEYLVGALDGTLSAERLVTNTSTVTWDLATAGQVKANVVALASGTATRTAGDLTTTNIAPSWQDATGISVTITTGARRCLVTVNASGKHSASDTICVNLDIDGVSQGQSLGVVFADSLTGQNRNLSFTFLTAALSAASHTFKLQFATGSSGTMTLYASSGTAALTMGVVEVNT